MSDPLDALFPMARPGTVLLVIALLSMLRNHLVVVLSQGSFSIKAHAGLPNKFL